MELGGHAACIVCDDANLDLTIEAIVRGKWRNGGQVCISMSRLFVQASIAEEFLERLVVRIGNIRLGPGTSPDVDMGPLTSERSRKRAEAFIEDAVECGGRIIAGGGRPSEFPRGYFFEPTLVLGGEGSSLWREEPFGPILPMTTFGDLEEALSKANDVDFGLAGYGFTRSLERAFRISRGLDVGMVGINNLVIALPETPAGGVKASGFGREGGSEALADYTVSKYTNMRIGS